MNHALVVGATGVIGGAIAQWLLNSGRWKVTCVSRSGISPQGAIGLPVDLLEAGAIAAARNKISPVTHLFYAGYQARPTRLEEVEPNLALLRHSIDLAEAGGQLQRTVLVTGGKYYGLQWGAIKTPARETDPRHLGPNFYYGQHDLLVERAHSGSWTWAHLIPPYVTGYADSAPMNLVMAIAVLATLSYEAGLPLRFPAGHTSWSSLFHIADASQIAAAAGWASESADAANQIFNVANGDSGRWRNSWDSIAKYFNVMSGPPLPIPLQQIAQEQAPVWQAIAERDCLRQKDIMKLVDWNWADYMFKTAFSNDVLFELGKIRKAGFTQYLDTEEMLIRRFDELREKRFIPFSFPSKTII